MFTKEDRSTFSYWFAHWCAFQMTALNCHAWHFRFLFHDIEKPWMKLFMSYDKVHKWHQSHRRHHLNWLDNPKHNINRFDWEAMIIDWECSRFTKEACPRNAREELKYKINLLDRNNDKDMRKYYILVSNGLKTLSNLGL